MKILYKYIKPVRGMILVAMLLKAVSTLLDLAIPYVMGKVIDLGVFTESYNVVAIGGVIMLLFTLGSFITTIIAHKYAVKSSERAGEIIRIKLYRHIQQLNTADIERVSTGSLITRVTNDVEHVQKTVQMGARLMVRAPMLIIGGLFMSFMLDVYLTAIMFSAMLILFLISKKLYSMTRPLYRKVQKSMDALTTTLRENISGIQSIKAFGKMEYETKRVDERSQKIKEFEFRAGRINGMIAPSITLITNITIIAILLVSGVRVEAGNLEIGKVVTILNYINMVMMAMGVMPRMFMMLSRANTSIARIDDVFNITDTTSYGEQEVGAHEDKVLEMKDISFKYHDAKGDNLRHISFDISKGEVVGIIGGTGAGKTTLINLMLRLYEPCEGEIFFEGKPIQAYKKTYIKDHIIASIQQYHILSVPIRENIILDQPWNEYDMQKCIKDSQISPLIEELEDGLEHEIAQNGNNLSGGQKQRINIARTLYRKSKLMILDDVSSALDYATDLKLRNALRKNYNDQSIIIVSQRISSVKSADKIIVLDKGEIVGIGKHDELIKMCSIYAQMCNVQERGGVAI